MPLSDQSLPSAGAAWRKLAALALAVAAVGLPVNHFASYVLLLIVTVVIFAGDTFGANGRDLVRLADNRTYDAK